MRTDAGQRDQAMSVGADGLDHRPRHTQVTIAQLYERAYTQYATRIAVRTDCAELTYAQLGERVHRIVGGLVGLGVRHGERVVLLLDNCAEFFEIEQAIHVGGFVRCALSTRLHPREVAHILTDCTAAAAVVSPTWAEHLAAMRADLPALRTVITVAGGPGDVAFEALREATPAPGAHPAATEPAAILYTSGTTGVPKGATLSHANWATMARNELLELPPVLDGDLVLHVAPLSHLSGYVAPSYFVRGATHLTTAKFDPVETLELIERHGVTILPMVPTMLNALVLAAEGREGDYATLHTVVYAGSPIAPDRLGRARAVLGDVFVQFYGLSEVPIPIACLSRADHAFDPADGVPERLASAGRVNPFVEVMLLDEHGHEVPAGEIGEITVRGDQLMMGYWGRPDATCEMIDGDGWARTGDLGRFDPEGYLFIVDRMKDMVVTGGFNVYPTEVENIVSTLPAVAEVAVVGTPDLVWGESLRAVIVVREGHQLTSEEVVAVCAANLAGYKKPRSVEFVTELPRTGSGKIKRRELRDRYWAGAGRRVGG